jgi:O-antigen ligase
MIFSWYRKALVFGGVVLFFTNFADYSLKLGIIPLYWIFAFGALCMPLAIPSLFNGHAEVPPLAMWAGAYLLISIAWFFPSAQTPESYQNLQTRVLSVIFLGLMLFILARPEDQHLGRIAIAWSVLLAVALNVYELFNPMTFSSIPGRSSGLYNNVNQSGAALVLGLILAYHIVPGRLRIPFALVTAIGIIPTFSRAAIVGWVLVMLFFAARSGLGIAQLRRIFILCIIVFGFLVSPYMSDLQQTLEERGTLTLDVVQRLNFLNGNTDDASTHEREEVAQVSWRLFTEKPITGYGTGKNRQIEGFEVGTHNIYLAMLIDHGILGILIVPGMLLAMVWGARKNDFDLIVPFVMFLTFWGFFSHNVLEERYILVSVALIGSIVASNRVREKRSSRQASLSPLALGAPA